LVRLAAERGGDGMAHRLEYLAEDGIVCTTYLPPTDIMELQQVVMENLAMAAETGALLFLGDCRRLPSSGSLIDVYQLGDMLDRLNVDKRMREALVVTPDPSGEGTFEFFRTVTTNRGIIVRLFGDIDEATRWLRAEGERLGFQAADH
jgi:hypothetical protein